VPIDKPGFYVLELASPALGRSLLAKPSSMYVRTTVLVTNLGVHLKQGRENNLVWVTTLDKGKPVPNAQIRVSDCNGDEIAAGKTDAQGLLKIDGPFEPQRECHTSERGFDDYFVSARVDDPKTGPDMAFVSSNWNRGIEAWRFNVPTDTDSAPTVRAHTVFDRTLLRAGETVSMKHFVRTETLQSLAFPAQYPSRVTIRHLGSDQTYKLPLTWSADHSADTQFTLPQAAKLGEYSVTLEGGPDDAPTSSYYSGSFRVEAFRLPVLKGTIGARDAQKSPLVAVKEAPLAVQIDYVSGGGASNLPVQVSALMKWASPPFADRFEDFSFAPYRPERSDGNADDDAQDGDNTPAANDDPDATRLIADKLPLTLDRNGAGSVTLKGLPDVDAPKRVALEATFADPNGEVQTIRGDTILWPAAVVAGIKAGHWVSVGQRVPVQALAVDLQGKPRASVPIEIRGVAHVTTSSRKRMVGGFYAYDNKSDTRELGVLCSGKTDDKGRMACDAKLEQAGNVQLIAVAKDGDGRVSNAATSVWVTREDDLWFGGDNTDRIDVIPEKTSYEPGETARFQVRMPFRYATALVAVERGGVMETHIVELNGKNPTVDLKVGESWGRTSTCRCSRCAAGYAKCRGTRSSRGAGRRRSNGRAFWTEGRHYEAPTAFVDLSKPAFRYGLGEIKVGTAVHRLGVTVTTDATRYTVRGKAQAHVKVTLPNGQPAPAGTQIAVAAVDEALLELMPNNSWDLLGAMLQRRAYGVETATAQMEIVGRRHWPQGRAGRRRRRQRADARAVRHAAAVESARDARRERQRNRRGAAERRAHALPDRRDRGGRPRPLRHRQHVDPQHAGSPADFRPAAAGARRRCVPRAAHAAQHDRARDAGGRDAARDGPRRRAAVRLARGQRGRRGRVDHHRAATGARRGRRAELAHRRGRARWQACVRRARRHAEGRAGAAGHRAAGDARAGRRHADVAGRAARGRRERRAGRDARRHRRIAASEARRRPARRAPLVRALSVPLPRTADVARDRPARCRAMAGAGRAHARLSRQRRARQLLPAAVGRCALRQSDAVVVPARGRRRSRPPRPALRAAGRPAHAARSRPRALRRRPRRAQRLGAAPGSRPAQARRDRGAVAVRRRARPHARLDRNRAEPVADVGGDRLSRDPQAREGHPAARRETGAGRTDPARTPDLPGYAARLLDRARRRPVVADDEQRDQRRAPRARVRRRPGVEGRDAARDGRPARAATPGRVADDHVERTRPARRRALLAYLREHAGRRHDEGRARRQRARSRGRRRRQPMRADRPPQPPRRPARPPRAAC
jgi:hypothetical protein